MKASVSGVLAALAVGLLAILTAWLGISQKVVEAGRHFLTTIPGTFSRPAIMAQSVPDHGFRKVQSFQIDYSPCRVTQYVSERSGMQVVIVARQGPKVNGYFTLATEVHDNSGSPHTLEHLIFQASKNYPYRGLLDKLTTRLYSSTNAWTAVDHTAYTLSAVGEEAFAQVLPLYLENILLPKITDTFVMTEVWNIGPDGKDGGVVYSEMQALESEQQSLMDMKQSEMLYPEGIGYRYNTGGMLEPLRNLTPERIRKFHKDMYQPRNLGLTILGQVDHERILRVLGDLETKIKADIPPLDSPFKRPWIDSTQPPPLLTSNHEVVEFPEEDESTGEVWVSWFGPSCNDNLNSVALGVLLRYLCGSSVSVFENTLVETEQVASGMWYDYTGRPNSVITLIASGVATDKLAHVRKRIFEIFEEVESKPLDMNYLHDCLKREQRKVRVAADGFDSYISSSIIEDFVFGNRDGSTLATLKGLDEYKTLEGWEEQDWKAFLRKWITGAHSASVTGKPSARMAAKIKADEEARIARRKEELGEEGLRKAAEKLEAAKAENAVPIPDSVLRQWHAPNTDSIPLIKPDMARAGRARELGAGPRVMQELIDKASQGTNPPFLQFEQVPWKFIRVALHVTTGKVPAHLLPLIPVFVDNFFKTPVMRNGEKIDFGQIIMEIQRETITYGIGYSDKLRDNNAVVMYLDVETEKYAGIPERMRSLMFDSVFDAERLMASVVKMLADVPEAKRDGNSMAGQVSDALHLSSESLVRASSDLVAAVYLKRLKSRLRKGPEEVISWFEELRKTLFSIDNIRIMVVGEVAELKSPVAEWDALTNALPPPSGLPMNAIVDRAALRTDDGKNPGSLGAIIVPMTAIDSSYAVSTAKGILGWNDARIPALLVAGAYLTMQEGPLWTAVRGQGLAYGVVFSRDQDSGIVHFSVYRSPDAAKALAASLETVNMISNGKMELDDLTVEAAISQVVVMLASHQGSPQVAAEQDFVWQVIRGLPGDIVANQLEEVRKITADDIRGIISEFVVPLLQPGKSNLVVTCATVMQEGMEKSLQEMGYKTQTLPLAHFHEDYGLEDAEGEAGEGGEGEEGEDGEDEDEDGLGSHDSGSEEDEED